MMNLGEKLTEEECDQVLHNTYPWSSLVKANEGFYPPKFLIENWCFQGSQKAFIHLGYFSKKICHRKFSNFVALFMTTTPGLFFFFSSFQSDSQCSIWILRWLVSNRGSLELEATALPTEPQSLPLTPGLFLTDFVVIFSDCRRGRCGSWRANKLRRVLQHDDRQRIEKIRLIQQKIQLMQ